MTKKMPRLESLAGRCNLYGAIECIENDVQLQPEYSLPLFQHVRSFAPARLFRVITEEQEIQAICHAFSPATFTTLVLKCYPFFTFTTSMWCAYEATYPLLSTIEFDYLDDHPHGCFSSLISSGLASRLTTLKFIKCSGKNNFETFHQDILPHFTNLQHLNVEHCLFNEINLERIVNLFEERKKERGDSAVAQGSSHAVIFLPHLISLRWIEPGDPRFEIEWNEEKGVNYVVVICQKVKKESKLNRPWRTEMVNDKNNVPAPRLVGIELNPGPTRVNSNSIVHLFDDGLLLILLFLDTNEWISAARSSKYWFTLAHKSKHLISHRRGDIAHEMYNRSFKKKVHKFFRSIFLRSHTPQPQWSLAHHVGELEISHAQWKQLNQQLIRFPSLTSIKLTQVEDWNKKWKSNSTTPKIVSPVVPLLLPSASLTSFHFGARTSSLTPELDSFRWINHVVDALAQCHSLTSLRISINCLHIDAPHWLHLSTLQQLVTLEVDGIDHSISTFLQLLLTLNPVTLQHLTLITNSEQPWVSDEEKPSLNQMRSLIRFPNLLSIDARLFTSLGEIVLEMSKKMPLLHTIASECNFNGAITILQGQIETERSLFPLFPHVHTYVTQQRVEEDQIACAFSPLIFTTLTSRYVSLTQPFCDALQVAYPHLNNIHLSSHDWNNYPLRGGLIPSSLCSRIVTLHLRHTAGRYSIDGLRRDFLRLQSLRHLVMDNAFLRNDEDKSLVDGYPCSSVDIIQLLETTEVPVYVSAHAKIPPLKCAFLPQLESIHWFDKYLDRYFDLEWNSKTKVNRIRYRANKQNYETKLNRPSNIGN